MDAFPAEEYVQCAEANLASQCTTAYSAVLELEERMDKLFVALQKLGPDRQSETSRYADEFRRMLAREKLFMARRLIEEVRKSCKEQPV